MSYPKLNSENNQIIGNLIVEPEFKILTESKKIEFKINSFHVKSNPRISDLIKKRKIKLGFTLECDTTFLKTSKFYGDTISWDFDDVGGKIKSSYFLICIEPFSIEPNPSILDPFYDSRVDYKKNYLISPPVTDIYDIRKLNIGSSVNFLKIEHKPELNKGSFAFWDDGSVLSLYIKDSETYLLAKKMLKKKNTRFLVRQLLFTPFFVEAVGNLDEEDGSGEWIEDFKKMLGFDDNKFSDFNERFNFILNSVGDKAKNYDGLKASLLNLEKIRTNN